MKSKYHLAHLSDKTDGEGDFEWSHSHDFYILSEDQAAELRGSLPKTNDEEDDESSMASRTTSTSSRSTGTLTPTSTPTSSTDDDDTDAPSDQDTTDPDSTSDENTQDPPSPSTAPVEQPKQASSLSAGAIAGIAIGTAVIASIISFLAGFFVSKRQKPSFVPLPGSDGLFVKYYEVDGKSADRHELEAMKRGSTQVFELPQSQDGRKL